MTRARSQRLIRERNKADTKQKEAQASKTQLENQITRVLSTMTGEQVDRIVGDKNVEFDIIATSIMAWYTLLIASGIMRREKKYAELVQKTLAASLIILGSLVKYAYALGMRRGRAQAKKRVRP